MKKLGRIKYNNKYFDIFFDENHQKHFFEVIKNEEKEEYVNPELNDLIKLNLIYNVHDVYTRYMASNNQNKLKKGLWGTITALSISASIFAIKGTNLRIDKAQDTLDKITSFEKVEEEDLDSLFTIDHVTMDDIDLEPVTVDDLRETLANNVFLEEEDKAMINEYISGVTAKGENIDLRILEYNLRDLQIKYGAVDSEGVLGKYDIEENIVYLENKEDLGIDYKAIFYHELTHVLHITKIENKYVKDSNKEICMKEFSILNGYGSGFEEGMTDVLAAYFMSPTVTNFSDYLDCHPEFAGYGELPYTCFDLMNALNGYYSINDFLNGDVYDLENLLKKIDSEEVLDKIDYYYQSYDDEVELVNEEDYFLENLPAEQEEKERTK